MSNFIDVSHLVMGKNADLAKHMIPFNGDLSPGNFNVSAIASAGFCDSASVPGGYGDAANALFFARALEHMKAQTFKTLRRRRSYQDIMTINVEGGEGVREIKYVVENRFGKAQAIDLQTRDVPLVDIGGEEKSDKVFVAGIGAQVTLQEMHAMKRAGLNTLSRLSPEQMRFDAAAEALDVYQNDLAWFGEAAHKKTGILTNPNVPIGIVDDPGSGTEWVNKTPEQIVADIETAAAQIWTDSGEAEKPNTLALPTSNFALISSTKMSEIGTETILSFLKKASMFFGETIINGGLPGRILSAPELEGAGTAGANVMMVYDRNIDKIRFELPVPTRTLPEQARAFTINTFWYSYVAGAIITFPSSISLSEGI